MTIGRRSFWLTLALAMGVAACGQQPVVVPARTLDRPTDLAFLCVEASSAVEGAVVTARPASACVTPPESIATRTDARLGLIANSARGELGAVDFDRNRMIDLDVAIPGFNMLPVGQLPESVAVSSDGCRALTANKGSCDLSVVDTTRLLTEVFPGGQPSTGPGAVTNRIHVSTDAGPLRSRPGEVVFVPNLRPAGRSSFQCREDGAFGGTQDDPALGTQLVLAPWRAVVTFPGCGLVALVDVPSGRLVDSVFVQLDGSVVPAGRNPQCPVECAGSGGTVELPVPADAGAPDAGLEGDAEAPSGATVPGRLAVSASAFLPYQGGADARQRLYVGGRNAGVVVPLGVAEGGSRLVVERPAVTLVEEARGVLRLRPAVDPYEPGERAFIGADLGQFLYVIAADGSARVLDVSAVSAGGAEVECDANVDSGVWARMNGTLPRGCIPVSLGLPRRLGTRGPGVQVPLGGGRDIPPPAAVDVAFFQGDPAENGVSRTLRVYNGSFAYLLLTNGDILVANIDSRQPELYDPAGAAVLPPAHSLRNSRSFQDLRSGGGPPRVASAPIAALTTNGLPFATRPQLPRELYPRLESFSTDDPTCSPLASPSNPLTIFACFPRPNEAVDQRWELTWEGSLPGTVRDSGRLLAGASGPAAFGTWSDVGANYCAAGVQPGDRLRLVGCNVDADCGPSDVFRCVASAPGIAGLCARRERAAEVAASLECQALVRSRRRYEVVEASATTLAFGPLLDELPLPTTEGPCQSDAVCQKAGAPDTQGLRCVAPVAGQGPRCVRPCQSTEDCREGFVCAPYGTGSFCAEAPAPDPLCVSESSIYVVQAGQSFLISGARATPFAPAVEVNGVCRPNADRDPRQALRVPLAAPLCSATVDCASADWRRLLQEPMTSLPGAWPNPCLCQGPNADEPGSPLHTKAVVETPELRFVVTNLEQPFGDGATISLQVTGGFWPDWILTPSSGSPSVAVPTRILVGPTKVPPDDELDETATKAASYPYIYIVDSGRLGSQQRGQLLRLDTRRAGYDTARTSRRFEVQ